MDCHDSAVVVGQNEKKVVVGALVNNSQHDCESSCESLDLSETRSGVHGIEELAFSDLSDGGENNGDRGGNGHTSVEKHGGGRRGHNNQRGDDVDDAAARSWSSLSVDASDSAADVNDGRESLSLSVSTESEADVAGCVLYSSLSDASGAEAESEEDGDAHSKVLLPDVTEEGAVDPQGQQDDSMEPGSLSGEISSSSFEMQYFEDDDEVKQTRGDADDDLWRAFDQALHRCQPPLGDGIEPGDPLLTPTRIASTPPPTEDDGYDGSASESASVSSLDESVNEQYSYVGIRPERENELIRRNDNTDIDSLDSSPPARRVASSVSSLASSGPLVLPWIESDQSDGSLSNISGDEAHERQWIENVPVLRLVDPPYRDTYEPNNVAGGIERPPVWRQSEYVHARTRRSRSQRRRSWGGSDESLVLEGEGEDQRDSPWEEDQFNALPTLMPTKTVARVPFDDVDVEESYVSYADLAGIIEAHVTRRPGVMLDLGCGTSRVCEELVFHGYKCIIGVDKDLSAIAFQRQQPAAIQLPAYLQFWPMDAGRSLLLPDRSCDCILSKATLDAIAARGVRDAFPSELIETLKETIRCLKPGGILMAVVYQENLFDKDDSEDGEPLRTKAERIAARLLRPWWRWEEVRGLLGRQLTLVREYALGRPRVIDGVRTKPYKVLVWRRRETDHQRLRRLLGDLMNEKRQQGEYDTQLWLRHNDYERDRQEVAMIRESRQMILEDERSRLERAVRNELVAVQERQQRRDAFYAALLEEERRQLEWEDQAGAHRRALEREMKAFVKDTVLCDLVIGNAVDFAVAKRAEDGRKKQEEAAFQASINAKRVKAVADAKLQAAATITWVRELVIRIAHAAVASSGGENLLEFVPSTDTQEPPAHTQRIPADQTDGPVVSKEASKTAAIAVAAEAVASILSIALSSVSAGDGPSNQAPGGRTDTISVVTETTTSTDGRHLQTEVEDGATKAAVVAAAAETVAWILSTAMGSLNGETYQLNQDVTATTDTVQINNELNTKASATDRSVPMAEKDNSLPREHSSHPLASRETVVPIEGQTSVKGTSSRNESNNMIEERNAALQPAPEQNLEDAIAQVCVETLDAILSQLAVQPP